VDRCALFVDADYALGDGALAVHGTRHRDSVSWDYAGLLKLLAGLARDRTGLPVLRCYWYEATVDSRRTAEHDTLADIPGLKLRLGKVRPGRREGVETEIRRDLTTLARNKAVSDVIIVSAEEDLSQVISDVQDQGIRVAILHISTGADWTISRALRQECDDIVEISAGHLSPYVDLISGAEPASRDDEPAAGRYPVRGQGDGQDSPSGGATASPVPQAVPPLPTPSRALPAAPSLYPAPIGGEYPRTAQPQPQPLSGSAQPAAHSPAHDLTSPGMASHASSGQGSAHAGNLNPSVPSAGITSSSAPGPGDASSPGAGSAGIGNAGTGGPGTGNAAAGASGGPQSGTVSAGAEDLSVGPGLRAGSQGQDYSRGLLAGPDDTDSGRLGSAGGSPRADDLPARMQTHQYQVPEQARGAEQPRGPASSLGQPGPAQNGLPQNGLPQNGLPHNGLPQNGLPQNGLPQNGLPQSNAGPQNGMTQNGLPQNGLSQNGLPQANSPQNGLPQNGLPQNGLPQGPAVPQNGLPQNGLPQNGLSQNGLPQNGFSQQAPPSQGPGTGEFPRGGGLPQHGQTNQPQHGQSQQGPPQHGQSQQGPPQHGQSQHGQSQHGSPQHGQPQQGPPQGGLAGPDNLRAGAPQRQLPAGPGAAPYSGVTTPYGQPQQPQQPAQQAPYAGNYGPSVPPQAPSYPPSASAPYGSSQPGSALQPSMPQPISISLADAVQAAHAEGFGFGEAVARDAPALWLEAVLARKPRMPSDLEARLLQGSALPIDSLLHDEVRHALRRGFWDALERSRR
jgi:hypothetical protein